MPRKLRVEYPGACYHVINRGNFRSWVFLESAAAGEFERVLFQACVRNAWVLHAFVVMGNHFHLALETPRGNLVNGMQWLQSTFASRYNRKRKESGHLFQGRYRALVVEDGEALGCVCHYIHLNPVRGGIVPFERLAEHRYSSYWYLLNARNRPSFMKVQTALQAAGGLQDSAAGWKAYEQYLLLQDKEGPAGRSAAYQKLSKGWALGSSGFRDHLLQEYADGFDLRAWDSEGTQASRAEAWAVRLSALRRKLGNVRVGSAKADPVKVALAAQMKQTTDASNAWLAEHLQMGGATYVSKCVSDLHRVAAGASWELFQRLRLADGKACPLFMNSTA